MNGRDPREMSLTEHLGELRSRLLVAALALVVGSVAGWVLYDVVIDFLLDPYCALPQAFREGGECRLVAFRVLEQFSLRVKVAMAVGFVLAGPILFYQVWRFISPGLTDRERSYSVPFVVLSQLMFLAGAGFAYYVIPKGLRILLGIGGRQILTLLGATEYFNFLLTTVVAFGFIFEVPLLLVFLAAVGIVSSSQLRRFRPYAIVANAIIAALITPTPDAVTMLFMMGPMVVLYEGSILAAWLIERGRRRRAASATNEDSTGRR